jgi:Holliday junction DNA helicase RuvA
MIAWLRGRLLEKHPNRLILDVNGVGYDVQVPLSTFYDVAEVGTDVSLRVHTHVREDVIALYGFGSALEQQLFERLIGVSGIGPKLALAALSGIEPDELVRAVRTSDVARLSSIPGIGKKTAERITLELKDKLPAPSAAIAGTRPAATPADEMRTDLLSALLNLGYQRPLAEKAVDAALKATGPAPSFEHALRGALRALARP